MTFLAALSHDHDQRSLNLIRCHLPALLSPFALMNLSVQQGQGTERRGSGSVLSYPPPLAFCILPASVSLRSVGVVSESHCKGYSLQDRLRARKPGTGEVTPGRPEPEGPDGQTHAERTRATRARRQEADEIQRPAAGRQVEIKRRGRGQQRADVCVSQHTVYTVFGVGVVEYTVSGVGVVVLLQIEIALAARGVVRCRVCVVCLCCALSAVCVPAQVHPRRSPLLVFVRRLFVSVAARDV